MRYVFRRHLFLLIGLLTIGLFVPLTALGGPLAILMRVPIAPMYLVWLLATMGRVAIAGPGRLPGPFEPILFLFTFFAGLAPYALADYVLDRWRHNAARKLADRDIS
jgi:hypothetical protein